MITRRLVVFSALALAASSLWSVSRPALADDTDDAAKTAIQAEYDKVDAAMKDKDVKALEEIEADDFTEKDHDGDTIDKEKHNSQLEEHMKSFKDLTEYKNTVDDVKLDGDHATTDVTFVIKGTREEDGKDH